MGAELLARLGEKTTNWSSVGGGRDVITASDVAAMLAMGGADEAVGLYAIIKYANHVSMDAILYDRPEGDRALMPLIGELRFRAYHRAVKTAERKGWREKAGQYRPQLVRRMSELAIAESISTGVCKRCRGVKFARLGEAVKVCPCCKGSGVSRLSEHQKAELLNVPWTSFRREWGGRYEQIHRAIHDWDADVRAAVKRARYDDHD